MLNAEIIGNKIAVARKMKNLSQSQLAQLLSISSQAVGKWERGESMPDIITFNRLAETLGTDLNYFSESYSSALSSISLHDAVIEHDAEEDLEEGEEPGWNMSASVWKDADFSGLNGLHERFSGANISNCLFMGSELSGITFKGNSITDSDFSKSDILGSHISHSHITKTTFTSSNMSKTIFKHSHIENCDFTDADLSGVSFKGCELRKNKVSGIIWNTISFNGTGLVEMIIEGDVRDCSFENCKYTKLEFRNATLRNTFFKNGNMKKISFSGCKADKLTYAFLKNGKANVDGIEILE